MNENVSGIDNTEELPVIKLIFGDLFEGFAVSDFSDKIYEYHHDGKNFKVIQKALQSKPDRLCVGFLFLLDEPKRFRVDVLVPDNCTNARVSLQGEELIGYFSPDIPDDPEPMITTKCSHQQKISTLHPGEFQSINFRWESGDVLKFYFYFGDYSASF